MAFVLLLAVLWQTGVFPNIYENLQTKDSAEDTAKPAEDNISLPEALEEVYQEPLESIEPTESPAVESSIEYRSDNSNITLIARNLEIPWEILTLPDGRMMVTERPGYVVLLGEGTVLKIDDVYHEGEGGLLGMAPDPDFYINGYIYVYYTVQEDKMIFNRVVRYMFEGTALHSPFILLDHIPGATFHNGGRIKFGPDGYLYVTTGDAQVPALSQDEDSLAGKILRIQADGRIPHDNPFPNSPVYSLGHRNPQGLAWHPSTQDLYASEHGPNRMDEVNLLLPGRNYGWPHVTGDDQSGAYENAVIYYEDFTLAPSGMVFFPDEGPWKDNLFVAGLRGNMLMRLVLDDMGQVTQQIPMLTDIGRIRNVIYHDGALYVLTNNSDGRGNPTSDSDIVLKIEPLVQSQQ